MKSRLRSTEFKFPIYRDGIAVRKFLWKSNNITETGLQVSNLYIAQVKRKCGIVERVNYRI